jgi:RNA polymerase sigma-70 factor (ECF subfamily)
MILGEEKSRLRQCLYQLDEKSQDIIILSYWEDMTPRQIAAILNLPEGTVKVTKMRAKKALRQMMIEELAEETEGDKSSSPQLKVLRGMLDTED